MGTATETAAWVGRALPRLEDEVLLRGEGRFMDDLDPVPNARHAAILRSPFAHARIARVDPSAALELPGVVGVLTGEDVAALSRPFPVGVDGARPYYAAAVETARYAGEPVAVVMAKDGVTVPVASSTSHAPAPPGRMATARWVPVAEL